MKFLSIQATEIRASRKSLDSSTNLLRTAFRNENQVEPYPEENWAPLEIMSEGMTLDTVGVGRALGGFFCLRRNMRCSGETTIRQTCAAHPFSAETSCTAVICSLLKSLRVCESYCVDKYCGVITSILSSVASIPNTCRLCLQTCVSRVPPAGGGEQCSLWSP